MSKAVYSPAKYWEQQVSDEDAGVEAAGEAVVEVVEVADPVGV